MKVDNILSMMVGSFATLVAALFLVGSRTVFEPPYILPLLNAVFFSIILCFAAYMKKAQNDFVTVFDVITGRKEVENALRLSEERLSLALAAAKMGVWEWDLQSGSVIWSPECHAVVGLEDFDGTFDAFAKLLHPDDAAHVMATVERALEQRSLYTDEFRIIRPDGELCWLSNRGQATYDDKGVPVRLIGTVHNVTERKRLDAEVLQALAAAEAANGTMSRLLRTVAHEFRTPLGLLTGSADILDRYWERLTPEKRFEQNEHIRSAARQLSNLINSVISYNRFGSDMVQTHRQLLDVGRACRAIGKEVQTIWDAGHRFSISIAGDCGTVLLDEILFRHIVENLLTNAFRYSPPGGAVSMNVRRENGMLLLEVIDSGIGIPDEEQKLIFDAFYRSRNVEGRRGLGLGLSIVNDSLAQLGGSITVNSRIGEGTAMLVEIPVAVKDDTANADNSVQQKNNPGVSPD